DQRGGSMPKLAVSDLYTLVRNHGAKPGVDRCMVAGALQESGGDLDARGDWEGGHAHSVGLWQLHDQGLGAGMTEAQRANPDTACGGMRPECARGCDYWAAQGLTGEDLGARTYLWAERPAGYNLPGSTADRGIRSKWLEANEVPDNTVLRNAVMAEARNLFGIPYRIDPPPDGVNNLDCSLFVVKTFGNAGIPFPLGVRTAEQIRRVCDRVEWPAVQRGDLLFFEGTYDCQERPWTDGHVATHIGISLGKGTMQMFDCHAKNGSNGPPGVAQTDISGEYWPEHPFPAPPPP